MFKYVAKGLAQRDTNMFTVLRRKCVYGISRITHETRVSVTRLTRYQVPGSIVASVVAY